MKTELPSAENLGPKTEVTIHDTDKAFRQIVELPDGQTVMRDQVEAVHDGHAIKHHFIYHPDPQNNQLESAVIIQNQPGYMAVGDDYSRIALRMALNGRLFSTYQPLRKISAFDQLHDSEHSKDALLYTAQVGQTALNAELLHLMKELDIDVNIAELTCHSMGGPIGVRIAKLSPEVRSVVLQDVAGVIDDPMKSHVKGMRGMLDDGIATGKATKQNVDALTPDLMSQHIEQTFSNPILTIREGASLVKSNIDISEFVNFARNEHGTLFGGIYFELSDFFPYEEARACARRKKLFDVEKTIKGRHCEPNTNPFNADDQLEVFQKLELLALSSGLGISALMACR
jgi:pimeloyl-ACP methyl ester carboxylesterase